ncbi:MAG TPA: hypothetical protein DEA80_26325 [Afipia sp.]|uniref:Uncharacterized protein n=1 Tax=Afipia broomeae ATCC 49717 TaxID=883078 RepID=K8PCI0_9BRAD|nr:MULTISPECIES: hypothetical protein [Afipia]MAH69826.1 hypothetical protein [Afipia sp.]OUX61236.1 MAG: hypothetical protein CBB64_11345 [Afipia sp. TMED4]EKS38449.1 hypothetical protein HMPREF9695_02289 [Afipia broomeae ATCC 49717]HAO40541.1 hypothetical protein [Afipia sp.]HAP11845.1 hypothetical protein [Afipia sp.]
MFRCGLIAFVALSSVTFPATGWAYEIKPKVPETAFSPKLQPDIVGLSSSTEGSKASPLFEAYLKDLPGVKPETAQQKFGGTNVTYVTAMKFTLAPTSTHPGESMLAVFSSPASANRAYYISRVLGFSAEKQPSKAEMIERVTAKYGQPTAIGDGRMYYFYKAGKVMSVKQKYTPASALEALNAPLNPKAAVALNDANGRGSCVAELKRAQALEKTLDKLVTEAKAANCDALVSVEIFPGITPDRVSKAEFTLIDFKQIISAAKIDADAFAAEKNEALNKTPLGNAPKL